MSRYDTSAQVNLLFGRIYLAIGKPAKALGFFEDASFESLSADAEAHLGLAEADLAIGDLGNANRILVDQVNKNSLLQGKVRASKAFQELEKDIESAGTNRAAVE